MDVHDIIEDENNFYIISELIEGGSIFERLKKKKHFNEKETAFIIKQIVSVVLYLHQRDIVHRDLKLENLLFTSKDPRDLTIKLIDFGFACKLKDDSMTHVLGSPFYMAPEIIQRQEYNNKVDIWSLGCLAYILISGESPFQSEKLERINHKILNKPIHFLDEVWL